MGIFKGLRLRASGVQVLGFVEGFRGLGIRDVGSFFGCRGSVQDFWIRVEGSCFRVYWGSGSEERPRASETQG